LISGCGERCNDDPEKHAPDGENVAAESDAGPVGEHFAEAVAMLARLPLTDAERAEAVRRLMAGATGAEPV
jgi:hypothetical protein